MAESILTKLYTMSPYDFTEAAVAILGRGARLYNWGSAVLRARDPIHTTVRTLIFANGPRILAELTDIHNNRLFSYVFRDIHDPLVQAGGGFRGEWTDDQIADYIDSINVKTNKYGFPVGRHSTTLPYLAQYLRGDLHDIRPLLHAISARIIKSLDHHIMERTNLAAVTIVLHTYLFHYLGWSPNYAAPPCGVKHDIALHLAGATLHYADDNKWDAFYTEANYGLPDFAVLPRVPMALLVSKGAIAESRITFSISHHNITFVDYGEAGVALVTQTAEGHEVAYFLTWSDDSPDYEEALTYLFA